MWQIVFPKIFEKRNEDIAAKEKGETQQMLQKSSDDATIFLCSSNEVAKLVDFTALPKPESSGGKILVNFFFSRQKIQQ